MGDPMNGKPLWMVRAGEAARAASDFREKSVVSIGWGDEDWTHYRTRDEIINKLSVQSPELSSQQTLVAASQIERFLRKFQLGDRVLTYDASRRMYLLGTIQGGPEHNLKLII